MAMSAFINKVNSWVSTRYRILTQINSLCLCIVSLPKRTLMAELIKHQVYTPPYAAKYGCQIFDEKTGRVSHTAQCRYFSEFGLRL